jgi:hypothetical protein
MSKFDELLQEMLDAGVQEDFVDRLRQASDGSPLRKERDEAVKEAGRLRGFATKSAFSKVGIKVSPEVLSLPKDLDVTDEALVREWAEKHGIVEPEPKPEASAAELEEGQQIEGAMSTTAVPATGILTPETVAGWGADKMTAFAEKYPREWEALKRAEPVSGEAANFQ